MLRLSPRGETAAPMTYLKHQFGWAVNETGQTTAAGFRKGTCSPNHRYWGHKTDPLYVGELGLLSAPRQNGRRALLLPIRRLQSSDDLRIDSPLIGPHCTTGYET